MMQRIGEDFAGEEMSLEMMRAELSYVNSNVLGQIDPSQWTGGEQVAGFQGQCEVG